VFLLVEGTEASSEASRKAAHAPDITTW
jgi:hypothetical protein